MGLLSRSLLILQALPHPAVCPILAPRWGRLQWSCLSSFTLLQERESLWVLLPPEGQEGRKDDMEAEGEQGHKTPGHNTQRMGILVVVKFLFIVAYLYNYDTAVLPIYFPEIAATKRGKFSSNWKLQLFFAVSKTNKMQCTVSHCDFLYLSSKGFFHITVLLGTIMLHRCLYRQRMLMFIVTQFVLLSKLIRYHRNFFPR